MDTILTFDKEEYDKLVELLGLTDNSIGEEDTEKYFDAWNFGQSENDCNFYTHASLSGY